MKRAEQPIPNEKQLEALKNILLQSSKRDGLLFVLAINSGLKVSEILQLQIGDVLDEDKNIRPYSLFYNEKVKVHKWFAVNENSQHAIKDYMKERKVWKQNEPLLKSQKGTRSITRQHAWYILNTAAIKVGLEKISSHTLQKIWGYYAYKSGVDIAFLQQFFGHRSPSTTLKYIGIQKKG
ncbi:tyrosine-type recombinase/integrase [Bacillus mycoides]|uniref:tyrosine-type recombinase/integrase n=1 Tax=Bacillus mycoides TaxID=1405 RepID=UPI002112C2C5|nr:tyrosine-type recombinase/integrase [Bacillus mycoides]MCQ6531041.1 tyrosine-type recombinase/integrase [Bacillus mycoides]